jgi:diguanylate cyclase (GGDEF)-like protein
MDQVGRWFLGIWIKLTHPRSEDPEKARREQVIRTILLLCAFTQAVLTAILFPIWLAEPLGLTPLLEFLVLDFVILICWWLIYLGHPFLAGSSLAGTLFLLGAFLSYTNGLNSIAVATYAVAMLMFSLFIGSAARWTMLILSIVTHIVLGSIHQGAPLGPFLGAMVSASFNLVAVAMIEGYYSYLLKKALSQSQQAEQKLRTEIAERMVIEARLKQMSTHDSLTGLFNRTLFEAELERLASSRLFPISMIMADLDGLKRTNDRLGHASGDGMLVQAAKVLSDTLRSEDMIARIGGDEFAILLPQTNPATLRLILSRLRKSLDEYNHIHPDRAIELSLGTATGEAGADLRRVLQQADDRMYEDKFRRKAKIPG